MNTEELTYLAIFIVPVMLLIAITFHKSRKNAIIKETQ